MLFLTRDISLEAIIRRRPVEAETGAAASTIRPGEYSRTSINDRKATDLDLRLRELFRRLERQVVLNLEERLLSASGLSLRRRKRTRVRVIAQGSDTGDAEIWEYMSRMLALTPMRHILVNPGTKPLTTVDGIRIEMPMPRGIQNTTTPAIGQPIHLSGPQTSCPND